MRLHRPILAILGDDERAITHVPTTRPRVTDRLPQRRCANTTCRCVLARDNPERFCSPCLRSASDTPDIVLDFIHP